MVRRLGERHGHHRRFCRYAIQDRSSRPAIRGRALAAIDQGGDLDIWARDNPKELSKRKAALERARAQFTGPQPARKRLKPPRRVVCDLVAGDVLALDLPGGPVLIRTVHVRSDRYGESPTLEELEFKPPEVPPAEIILQLHAKVEEKTFANPFFTPLCFATMPDDKKAGWKEAGFRKVANIPVRAGDEMASTSHHIFWWAIAREYRKRRDGRPT